MGGPLGASERDLLFVYGTLMRGERSAHRLGAASFVGAAKTAPRYWLAHIDDSYPALVEGGSDSVTGELHEVDVAIFPELDAYEDVPLIYQRVRIALGPHRPWVYLYRAEYAVGRTRIASGDWRRR